MAVLLRDVITIPEPGEVHEGDFVLKLAEGVEHTDETVAEYVVTPDLARAFDAALGLVRAAVTSGRSQAALLHGSHGSGKSHFMAVLHALLRHHATARGKTGLAEVIARHDPVLRDRRILPLTFHMIGAQSVTAALLGGYVAQIRRLHEHALPPIVHRTDALFTDAARLRETIGDEAFFAKLNTEAGEAATADGDWGAYLPRWNADSFATAVAALPEDANRQALAGALTRTFYTGYTQASEYVDLDTGLRTITEHAKGLGYDAVAMFLDELIIWLIMHADNQEFFNTEAGMVTKLVESAEARRPIPLVSFIARQRDLRDFLSRSAMGVQEAAFGATVLWQDDRFDKIVLGDENLPLIAEEKLLRLREPRERSRAVLDAAFARVDRRPDIWNTLLDWINTSEEHRGSDQASFRRTYPFSPALVDALRALAGQMNRDRTALKVMQHILVDQRDELTVDDVIPVGDIFDLVVSGDQALTPHVERLFTAARRLYRDEFEPVLLRQHGLTAEQAKTVGYRHAFRNDARLVKTLLLAAMVDRVPALHQLDPRRLAALNHGTIVAPLEGDEVTIVLTKLRQWKADVPALRLTGDERNPTISVQLSEVDWRGVLDNVATIDDTFERRRVLRQLVWRSLQIDDDPSIHGVQYHTVVWRGSRRTVELLFGNVRDPDSLTDSQLVHGGTDWRLVIDYPFDEPTETRSNDFARVERLRARGVAARTICWIPRFLTEERMRELSTLVQIEHLFATRDGFDRNADHLTATEKPQARAIIENLRASLTQRLHEAILQAYGAAAPTPTDVDVTGEDRVLDCLEPSFRPLNPVGATLSSAFINIVDRALAHTYERHPDLGPGEVRVADTKRVLAVIERSRQEENGRVANLTDPNDRAALRRLVEPLELGRYADGVYVLDAAAFPWRNRFANRLGNADTVTVREVRSWLDADAQRGLDETVGNLIIAAWAVVTDRTWYYHGPHTPGLDDIHNDMELREQPMPSDEAWAAATATAGAVFGLYARRRSSATALATLASQVRTAARASAPPADELVSLLTAHAGVLGLDPTAPSGRLATARAAVRLITDLVAVADVPGGVDRLALVDVLAGANLPAEPAWVGTSISQAGPVCAALSNTRWELFAGLSRITDSRRPQAQAILAALAEAGRTNEFQTRLPEALRTAENAASRLLAGPSDDHDHRDDDHDDHRDRDRAGDGAHRSTDVDEIATSDVDAAVERLRRFAADRPGRRIVVTMRVAEQP